MALDYLVIEPRTTYAKLGGSFNIVCAVHLPPISAVPPSPSGALSPSGSPPTGNSGNALDMPTSVLLWRNDSLISMDVQSFWKKGSQSTQVTDRGLRISFQLLMEPNMAGNYRYTHISRLSPLFSSICDSMITWSKNQKLLKTYFFYYCKQISLEKNFSDAQIDKNFLLCRCEIKTRRGSLMSRPALVDLASMTNI